MALLLRKRLIVLETESTYGTDPTPTGADAVRVRDLSITPQASNVVSRDLIRPYLGASQQLLANTRVECTFSVEMTGSKAAGTAPQFGKALEACGLHAEVTASTSVVYTPVSGAFTSITIHYMIDGVRHKVTGCRGTFSITAEVGSIPTIDFSFTGIYNNPDDSALLTPTYDNQADPLIFKNDNVSGFQILSNANAPLQSFSFDIGNTLVYRELIGNGAKEVLITDRAATGSVSVEATALGTFNPFATAVDDDASLGNLVFTHGSAGGNKVKFESTKVDIGDVSYGDSDGIAMFEIPYTCVPAGSAAADTEFALSFL